MLLGACIIQALEACTLLQLDYRGNIMHAPNRWLPWLSRKKGKGKNQHRKRQSFVHLTFPFEVIQEGFCPVNAMKRINNYSTGFHQTQTKLGPFISSKFTLILYYSIFNQFIIKLHWLVLVSYIQSLNFLTKNFPLNTPSFLFVCTKWTKCYKNESAIPLLEWITR